MYCQRFYHAECFNQSAYLSSSSVWRATRRTEYFPHLSLSLRGPLKLSAGNGLYNPFNRIRTALPIKGQPVLQLLLYAIRNNPTQSELFQNFSPKFMSIRIKPQQLMCDLMLHLIYCLIPLPVRPSIAPNKHTNVGCNAWATKNTKY